MTSVRIGCYLRCGPTGLPQRVLPQHCKLPGHGHHGRPPDGQQEGRITLVLWREQISKAQQRRNHWHHWCFCTDIRCSCACGTKRGLDSTAPASHSGCHWMERRSSTLKFPPSLAPLLALAFAWLLVSNRFVLIAYESSFMGCGVDAI